MIIQLRKIGNSIGNIIPATFIKELNLRDGAEIDIKSINGTIIIEPVKKPKKRFPFSESELLNGLNAKTSHSDELAIIFENELGN